MAAIGDMPNDVPMLEWAGHAYAVSNAHPAAIAAADEVLGRNDDDAVAALIESLLGRGGETLTPGTWLLEVLAGPVLTLLAARRTRDKPRTGRARQDLSARANDDLAAAASRPGRQGPAHLLQLGAGGHLLRE